MDHKHICISCIKFYVHEILRHGVEVKLRGYVKLEGEIINNSVH